MAANTAKRALHYLVFKGTVREGNYGTRVVTFLKKTIEERGNKATVIGMIIERVHIILASLMKFNICRS